MTDKAKRLYNKLQSLDFFKIYFEKQIKDTDLSMFSEDEVKKMDMNKVIRILDNDGIITTENWNDRKDTFFNQRMETYKDSYTINEKIDLHYSSGCTIFIKAKKQFKLISVFYFMQWKRNF